MWMPQPIRPLGLAHKRTGSNLPSLRYLLGSSNGDRLALSLNDSSGVLGLADDRHLQDPVEDGLIQMRHSFAPGYESTRQSQPHEAIGSAIRVLHA